MKVIKPGTLIDDRFEVTSRLGTGGMGVVYLASQVSLKRNVAVKMLLPELTQRPEDRVRFRREAHVMSKIRHENAVEIYDYGVWEEQLYLVMELLSGVTLRQRMAPGVPMRPLERILDTGYQLADALAAAHAQSVVHRDLKPENVMLERRSDGSSRVVVVDFGLAFLTEGTPDLNRVTREGLVSGTPQYMSPEQARGERHLSSMSDIYSLGCILWEMVAGEPVFDAARTIDLVNMHIYVPPRSLGEVQADVPVALDDLVAAMLSKLPSDRPAAAKVRERLGELALGRTPRDRGRPDRLTAVRAKRAVTEPDRAVTGRYVQPTLDAVPENEPAESLGLKVAALGELTTDAYVLLGAAGFTIVELDGEPDVVWLLDDSLPHDGLQAPVVATRGYQGAESLAALVRLGFADVISPDATDATIVKKLARAARRGRRGTLT